MKRKKYAKVSRLCVACGTCLKKCPMNAMEITDGIMVQIDLNKCVGCSKCAKVCPASVIEIVEVVV